MTGRHSTKTKAKSTATAEPPALVMPDPDNLQVDLSNLPLTGPITLPIPRK